MFVMRIRRTRPGSAQGKGGLPPIQKLRAPKLRVSFYAPYTRRTAPWAIWCPFGMGTTRITAACDAHPDLNAKQVTAIAATVPDAHALQATVRVSISYSIHLCWTGQNFGTVRPKTQPRQPNGFVETPPFLRHNFRMTTNSSSSPSPVRTTINLQPYRKGAPGVNGMALLLTKPQGAVPRTPPTPQNETNTLTPTT